MVMLSLYTKPLALATPFCVFFKSVLPQEREPKLREKSMPCLMANGHGREKTHIFRGTLDRKEGDAAMG